MAARRLFFSMYICALLLLQLNGFSFSLAIAQDPPSAREEALGQTTTADPASGPGLQGLTQRSIDSQVVELPEPESLDWNDLLRRVRGRSREVVLTSFNKADAEAREALLKYKGFRTIKDELPKDLLSFLVFARTELQQAYLAFRDGGLTESHWDSLRDSYIRDSEARAQKEPLARRLQLFREDIRPRLVSVFERYAAYEQDPREPVVIQFIRVGADQNEVPEARDRMRAYLNHFLAAGFPIAEQKIGTRTMLEALTALPRRVDVALAQGLSVYRDNGFVSSDPGESLRMTESGNFQWNVRNIFSRGAHALSLKNEQNWLDLEKARQDFRWNVRSISGVVSHSIAALTGLNLVRFRRVAQNRNAFDRIVEPTSGLVRGAMTSIAISHSLPAEANHWLPLVVVWADKMFFSTYQQPMSAFFSQGQTWSFESAKLRGNQLSFIMLVLLNSIILRSASNFTGHLSIDYIATSLLPTIALSMSFSAIMTDAVMSSLRAVWAKAPIQWGLEQFRNNYAGMALLVTSVFTGWNVLWDATGVADLFNVTRLPQFLGGGAFKFREVLAYAAVLGATFNLARDHETVARWGRMLSRLLRLKPIHGSSPCETFLRFKPTQGEDFLGSVEKK